MVKPLETTNHRVEHKRPVAAPQQMPMSGQDDVRATPPPTRSVIVAQELFRLLRHRTFR